MTKTEDRDTMDRTGIRGCDVYMKEYRDALEEMFSGVQDVQVVYRESRSDQGAAEPVITWACWQYGVPGTYRRPPKPDVQ